MPTNTPQWGGDKTDPDPDPDMPAFLRRDRDTPEQADLEEAIADAEPEDDAEPAEDEEPEDDAEPTEDATPTEEATTASDPDDAPPPAGHNASRALIGFVERVERLNEELGARQEDRREVFAEAKAQGFDVAVLREVIRRRSKDPETVRERDALIATYEGALP